MHMHERLGDITRDETDDDVPDKMKHYFLLVSLVICEDKIAAISDLRIQRDAKFPLEIWHKATPEVPSCLSSYPTHAHANTLALKPDQKPSGL
jgi:hypothetical protein